MDDVDVTALQQKIEIMNRYVAKQEVAMLEVIRENLNHELNIDLLNEQIAQTQAVVAQQGQLLELAQETARKNDELQNDLVKAREKAKEMEGVLANAHTRAQARQDDLQNQLAAAKKDRNHFEEKYLAVDKRLQDALSELKARNTPQIPPKPPEGDLGPEIQVTKTKGRTVYSIDVPDAKFTDTQVKEIMAKHKTEWIVENKSDRISFMDRRPSEFERETDPAKPAPIVEKVAEVLNKKTVEEASTIKAMMGRA